MRTIPLLTLLFCASAQADTLYLQPSYPGPVSIPDYSKRGTLVESYGGITTIRESYPGPVPIPDYTRPSYTVTTPYGSDNGDSALHSRSRENSRRLNQDLGLE